MRIAVVVVLGAIVAVVADQLWGGDRPPSLAGSMRYGLLAAVLLGVIARKALKDRARSEARRSGSA